MIAGIKTEKGSCNPDHARELTTPLSGMICHTRASTYYNQPIYDI